MNFTTEICGRDKEVKEIYQFISSRVESKKPGTLYLTGPPGTGKSMSVGYVLDQVKKIPKVNINCMRAQSSKSILASICRAVGLKASTKFNESEMISSIEKKLTGRRCEPHLIVLDEMDQVPKSRNVDLIKTIFSWPNIAESKLILIGIANTVNLTSRYQSISSIVGYNTDHITKIIFRPYSSKDIKAIMLWYIENDENFEDAAIEPKALDMIALKFARENGDIRAALNALRSAIDDTIRKQRTPPEEPRHYPTPPSTPPLTPCKEKTNIASLANSMKKRRRETHYLDDVFPFTHQIILTCIYKLSSGAQSSTVDSSACKNLITRVLQKHGLPSCCEDYKSMLDNLELQGLIAFKKGRPREKIVLRASERELFDFVKRKDMIMDSIKNMA